MFRGIQFAVFLILVVLCPWIFGGNFPYVRTFCLAGTTLLLLASLASALLERQNRTALALQLLFALALGFCILQLTPGVPEFFGEHMPQLSNPAFVESNPGTVISAYPAATRQRMCELILGISVFVVSLNLLADSRRLKILLATVTANGALLAFFGIAQRVSWNGKLFWSFPLTHGGQPFASFVNANNAGGYLLLCLSCGLFFVAERLAFRTNHDGSNPSSLSNQRSMAQKFIESCSRLLANLNPKSLYLATAVLLMTGGVMATLSRSALLALVISAALFVIFIFRYGKQFVVPLVIGIVVSVLSVAIYLKPDQISETVDEVASATLDTESRILHWQDGLEYAHDYSKTGSGLGTYSYMYMPYQTDRHFRVWFRHAENQYLETYGEMGLVGIAFLGSTILASLWVSFSCFFSKNSFVSSIGALGLLALCGQIVSAIFDFGLYQPANSILFAMIMGGVYAQNSRASSHEEGLTPEAKTSGPSIWVRIPQLSFCFIFLVACAWATYESLGVESRKMAERRIETLNPDSNAAAFRLQKAISELKRSIAIRPDDAESHLLLGQANVLLYRLAICKQMLDVPENEIGKISEVWDTTDLIQLHRTVTQVNRFEPESLKAITENPPFVEFIPRAWEHYQRAEHCCDLTPTTLFPICLLRPSFHPEEESSSETRRQIEDGIARCPCSSRNLFGFGIVAHNHKFSDLAARYWNRCLEFSREFEDPIVEICRREMPTKMFFEKVLPKDPETRIRIARKHFGSPESMLPRKLLLKHTAREIEASDRSSHEKQFLSGEIHSLVGSQEKAIQCYKDALAQKPDELEYRIALSRSLLANGNYEQALDELKACARRNEFRYRRIIESLEIRARNGFNRSRKKNAQKTGSVD